jgi:hypothetical protein
MKYLGAKSKKPERKRVKATSVRKAGSRQKAKAKEKKRLSRKTRQKKSKAKLCEQ